MLSAILSITVSLLVAEEIPDTLDAAAVNGVRDAAARSSVPLQRVSADRMEKAGTISLHEALRTFSGVSIKDYGGIGGLKTVSIRNLGAQYTGICIDGTPVSNSRSGMVDISRFNLDGMESISVGTAGSDDIFRSAKLAGCAGVLDIVSKDPGSVTNAMEAAIRLASFNTFSPFLSATGSLGRRWNACLRAGGTATDGEYPYSIRNGSGTAEGVRANSDVLSGNIEADLGRTLGNGDLRLKASVYGCSRGLPGSVVLYTQNPSERLFEKETRIAATYKSSPGEGWRVMAIASATLSGDRYRDSDPAYPEPVDDSYSQMDATVSAVAMKTFNDRFSFSLAEDLDISHLDASIPGCIFPTRETSYTALSARYAAGGLSSTVCLVGTAVREQSRTGSPAPPRERLSPSACISWAVPGMAGVRLRASFKESYRLATFNELYYPRVGNKDIKPEKAVQSGLGLTWSRSWESSELLLSADGYLNNVRDKIVAVPTMFIWSTRNVGKVRMAGADLSASYDMRAGRTAFSATANFSYQKAADVTDPAAKNFGNQIAYVPRCTGSGVLTFTSPWFDAGYTLCASGERYSLDQNIPAYRIAPYADHSISAGREFKLKGCTMRVSAEAMNIGGTNYEIIQYYPMPGRSWRITLKIRY